MGPTAKAQRWILLRLVDGASSDYFDTEDEARKAWQEVVDDDAANDFAMMVCENGIRHLAQGFPRPSKADHLIVPRALLEEVQRSIPQGDGWSILQRVLETAPRL